MPPDFAPGASVQLRDFDDDYAGRREAERKYGLKNGRTYKVDSVQPAMFGDRREVLLLDNVEEKFLPAPVPEDLLIVCRANVPSSFDAVLPS